MPKKKTEAIKVVFRVRPLSSREKQDGRQIVTQAHEDRGVIEVCDPTAGSDQPPKCFTFDSVFSPESTQRNIYDTCAAPVVQSVLEGYNGTIFAYGQTGAGKTHTMEGQNEPSELRGIIPLTFQHIFDHVALESSNDKYLVRASYFEIYNEEIHDLLSNNSSKGLELKESTDTGVYVKDLISKVVKSVDEIHTVLQDGHKNRSVGATLMNAGSSRSHAVFSVVIECCSVDDRGAEHIRVGKLNLVDLAGSERQAKTGATGERLKEATKINLSLSALGNVISALVDGKSQHIPYRDSKLTRILQDSLGGNTRTVMCANAGPADYNYDETVSTLRYANRAKNIKNKPVINEDPKDAMLREYRDEVSALREQLLKMQGSKSGAGPTDLDSNHLDQSLNQSREMEEERDALKARLDDEAKVRAEIEEQRRALQKKLEDVEQKVMVGGAIADQAVKQEALLRKAEQEVIARREKEIALAREVEAKEEANLNLEEQYSSLNDEVAHKTKKLKKLYQKYKEAKSEISDLQSEFQAERNDLLQTIRDLDRQLKLRELIVSNFIPPRYSQQLVDEAVWNDENEEWLLPELKAPGLEERISSITSSRNENILRLGLDLPGPSARNEIGDGYSPDVLKFLHMNLDDSVEKFKLGNPYERLRSEKSKKSSSRHGRKNKKKAAS